MSTVAVGRSMSTVAVGRSMSTVGLRCARVLSQPLKHYRGEIHGGNR